MSLKQLWLLISVTTGETISTVTTEAIRVNVALAAELLEAPRAECLETGQVDVDHCSRVIRWTQDLSMCDSFSRYPR